MFRNIWSSISSLSAKPASEDRVPSSQNQKPKETNQVSPSTSIQKPEETISGRALPGVDSSSPKVVSADEQARSKASQSIYRTTNPTIAKYNKAFAESIMQVIQLFFNHSAHINYETERMVTLYLFWSESKRQLPPTKTLENVNKRWVNPHMDKTMDYVTSRQEKQKQKQNQKQKQQQKQQSINNESDALATPTLTPTLLSSTTTGTNELLALNLHYTERMIQHLNSLESKETISGVISDVNKSVSALNQSISVVLEASKARAEQKRLKKKLSEEENNDIAALLQAENESWKEDRRKLLEFHDRKMKSLQDHLQSPIVLPEVSFTTAPAPVPVSAVALESEATNETLSKTASQEIPISETAEPVTENGIPPEL